jgi:hypothetical protein
MQSQYPLLVLLGIAHSSLLHPDCHCQLSAQPEPQTIFFAAANGRAAIKSKSIAIETSGEGFSQEVFAC